nr:DUF481 domain-containing protein [Oceanococcus sp. HetDA_MAG_MS8]
MDLLKNIVAGCGAVSVLVFTALGAQAAEAESQPNPWFGKVAAGLVATSGNAESRSQNAEYELRYGREDALWELSSRGALLQVRSEVQNTDADGEVRSDQQTTAENYRLDVRAERRVNEQNYVFAEAEYFKDLFASIRTSTTQTLGYGRRLLNTDTTSFDLELGAGARQQELQATRDSEDEFVGQLTARLSWDPHERTSLTQRVTVQSGSENTVSESQTRIKFSVIGALWTQLGLDVRHNSQVSEGLESTDTRSSVSVLYEFGAAGGS